MPFKVVEVKRWELVTAFMLPFVVAFLVAVYNTHRINQAEKRIVQNSVKNAAQDEVRKQLLGTLREADRQACVRIEKLKEQNRAEALRNFSQLDRNLAFLHLEKTPEILAAAEERRDRDLQRNAPADC